MEQTTVEKNQDLYWVITGANNGIGLALAKNLKGKNKKLILVDKDRNNLEDFLDSKVFVCDLSDLSALNGLCHELNQFSIGVLVNNAGVGFKKEFKDMSQKEIVLTMQVNTIAPMILANSLLDNLSKNKGVILNVGSSAGFNPLPGMSLYAASKAFLINWSSSIWYELKDKVFIITFSPSGTNTNFQRSAGVKNEDGKGLLSPDHVAERMVEAVESRKSFVFLGFKNKLVGFVCKFFPSKFNVSFWGKLFSKMR